MRDFFRSPLFAIFLIVFVDVLGVGITVPVLPLFAQDELGATPFQIGLLPTLYFIVQMVAAPLLGRLSDRIGRRPVLIASQLGTFSALLLSAWAPSLGWLFLARVLDGITGGNITVAFAYVGDVSRPEQRARAMGVINAAFGAGFMFGPAIGGYLGGAYGPRVPFLAASVVSALTITLSIFRLEESRKPAHPLPAGDGPKSSQPGAATRLSFVETARMSGVPRLMSIGFFTQLAMLCFTSMWVLWADAVVLVDYTPSEQQRIVGQVFTVLGLFQLITQAFVVGPLVRVLGEKRMVTLGLLVRGAGWIGMALLPQIVFVFCFLPFAAMGSGIAQPALMALLTFSVPTHARGQAIGVMSSAESTGRVLGPMLAGVLFQSVSPGSPILVAGCFSFLAALIAMTIVVKKPGLHPDSSTESTA